MFIFGISLEIVFTLHLQAKTFLLCQWNILEYLYKFNIKIQYIKVLSYSEMRQLYK